MTIEQTLKDDERLSRKEACALIQRSLRLKMSTVEKKTIYPIARKTSPFMAGI